MAKMQRRNHRAQAARPERQLKAPNRRQDRAHEPGPGAARRVFRQMIDPDAGDAAYNRDLVRELLEQQQDAQGDQQNGQNANSEEGGGAQQSEGESQSDQQGQEGSAGDPNAESQDGDSSSRSDQEMNQDDLEAMQRELERAAQEAEQAEAGEQQAMSQEEAESMRRAQEQTQAMEQWLRRIPNDPGGLLRRKFQYQYQRLGRDQDGNNLWPDDEVQPW